MFFENNLSKLSGSYNLEPALYLSLRMVLKPWTLSFKNDTITSKTVSHLKCLKERKKNEITWQKKDLVLHSLLRTWDTFSERTLVWNLSHVESKSSSQTTICPQPCPHTLSHDIHRPDWMQGCWSCKGSISAMIFLHFTAKEEDITSTRQYIN